jgi:hypothetical protein
LTDIAGPVLDLSDFFDLALVPGWLEFDPVGWAFADFEDY